MIILFKKSLSEASETLIVKFNSFLNKYPVCIVYDALNDLSHELFFHIPKYLMRE